MRKLHQAVALALVAASLGLAAESDQPKKRRNLFWKISIPILLAGAAFDVSTSYGHREGNRLLASPDGRLGSRGTGIKFSILGGMVAAQSLLAWKKPETGIAMGTANMGTGLVLGGLGVRNNRVKRIIEYE